MPIKDDLNAFSMVEQLLERLTDIEPSQNVHLTSVNAMVQIIKKE